MPRLTTQDLELVCGATKELWNLFRNQQLFITGGTGFFGRWLLETFLEANQRFALNAHAVVLTRHPATFREVCPHIADHPAVTLLPGDVNNFHFPRGEFSLVIHAATEGPKRTLEFAALHGTRRFLLISSGAVYGAQPDHLSYLPETWPAHPKTEYAHGKHAAEAMCVAYSSDTLECLIARPFAFVGPYLPLDQGFAIGNFIRDALAAQPIAIRGDPGTTRSYLYAADLAVWLWTILSRGTPLRPYNVGSDQAVTMIALAEEVASIVCPGLPVLCSRTVIAKSLYVPSIQRATQELGLEQTVFLRDAIRKTAEWHGWQMSATSPEPVA
jgi:nucleoside-diphosphate-sugar epimerase